MKIIISENQHKFIRRYQEIEDKISDFILTHKLNSMDTFDGFMTELCWDVASEVVSKMNIPEEDYVTYRNQLIHFIRYNFYTELKEFWDRNNYWDDSKNINESYDKRMLRRRYQYISEFIDRALSRYDVCLYTDVIDFVDRVLDYTADNLYESLFILGRDDNHSEYYQDIYDLISENFVDRIHEFYEDNKHFCIDEDGNWINESEEGSNIPSALRRRINLFDHELNTTLRESDPCEYSRFSQYKRGIMNYALTPFLSDENISLDSDENFFEIRDYLLKIFENKIRLHYDAYSEIHCPDDPEIVAESLTKVMLRRRYQELKDWVSSDYYYLLDRGKSPYEAREMSIDHSPTTYLDDPDTQLEWTDKNFDMLRRFIENNFEDLIS